MSNTKSFKDLIVWQRSRDLAVSIYQLTENFPKIAKVLFLRLNYFEAENLLNDIMRILNNFLAKYES